MSTRRPYLRSLAVAAAVALALAACGGGATKRTAAPGDVPPAAQVGGEKGGESKGTSSGPAGASGSGAKSSAPAAARGSSVSSVRIPVAIPKPGRYTYDGTATFTVGGAPQEQSFSMEMRYEAARAVAAGMQQLMHLSVGAQNYNAANMIEWRPDGQYGIYTESRNAEGESKRCTFVPAMRSVAFPLKAGASWNTGKPACKEGGSPGTGGFSASGGPMKVLRTETVQIGGAAVKAFVIESKGSAEGSSTSVQQTIRQWFAPDHGLTVKVTAITTGTFSGTFEATLKSLTPA